MREFFELWKPKPDAGALLRKMNSIIAGYQKQGFVLSLRQLYYQLVSADEVPNTEKSYKRIGDIVSKARLGGLMDWDAIEDRVRVPKAPPQYDSLNDLLEAAFSSYRLPRLKGQDTYVELWVEKDALAGVLLPIARQYHVTLMVNRGYSSTSAMKAAGDRVRAACAELEIDNAVVLYLGDLDPSGEDMVRDVGQRLRQFVNGGVRFEMRDGKAVAETDEEQAARCPHVSVSVEKLALTPEQVEEYEPPPNPAKMTDSRAAKFVEEHGESSWEVDALPPRVLRSIITARLDELIDDDLVQEIKAQEASDKERLRQALESLEEGQ